MTDDTPLTTVGELTDTPTNARATAGRGGNGSPEAFGETDHDGNKLDAAREKFSRVADTVKDRYERASDGVQDRARRASEELRHGAESARQRYQGASETLREGYGRASDQARTFNRDLNDFVQENPGRAVLLATAAGFLIGLLFRGRD